jgi:hypothetical protein
MRGVPHAAGRRPRDALLRLPVVLRRLATSESKISQQYQTATSDSNIRQQRQTDVHCIPSSAVPAESVSASSGFANLRKVKAGVKGKREGGGGWGGGGCGWLPVLERVDRVEHRRQQEILSAHMIECAYTYVQEETNVCIFSGMCNTDDQHGPQLRQLVV